MVHFKQFLLVIPALFFFHFALAQPSLLRMRENLKTQNKNTGKSYLHFTINQKAPGQASLLLTADRAILKSGIIQWLTDQLQLRKGSDDLVFSGHAKDYQGVQIDKLQQYYKGIKVEHGVISEVDKAGKVLMLQMEFYAVPDNFSTKPVLSEMSAFQNAIRYVGAEKYVWDFNVNNNPDWNKPTGELVIVEDLFHNAGKMCLAYKFNIYALKPQSRQLIYVDAITGEVIFKDEILKKCFHKKNPEKGLDKQEFSPGSIMAHLPNLLPGYKKYGSGISGANVFGVADTRYSGQRTFFTTRDNFGEYELSSGAIGNNTSVTTLHCLNQPDISMASSIHDNDNVWTSAEFPNNINMALDAHWGMQKTVEYWWKVHNRKSFDNNNGSVFNYTFYRSDLNEVFDNAKWNGNAFFFGEGGFPPDNHKPWTSIDLVAHEFGHAVCQYTSNLVYQRESGALNEGFSDIWGACIKNFVRDTISPLTKQKWVIGDEITYAPDIGLRSMENPLLKQDPDTYLDTPRKWVDATLEGCPVQPDGTLLKDNCGVHSNSGVLNKWFYLLTDGGTGLNGNYFNYTVDPFGFDKAEKIAFFTEQILTPNSGFEAARIASQNAVLILASTPNTIGITAADTINLNKAWKAVGVINDSVFTTSNTPVFLTNAFTTVGIGKYGAIWAGTANNGIYRYDGREWKKAPSLTNHNIADIKADSAGRIWIAQYGRTGSQALGGGLSCYANNDFSSYRYYATDSGLSTRNLRSLYINNHLLADTFKRVWAAAFADITSGVSRPGSVIRGNPNKTLFNLNYKPFHKIESGVNPNFGYCQTIGGYEEEVWVFASNNGPGGRNQLLRYKTADTSFIGFVDYTNSTLPDGFNAKAIYYDTVGKRWWVGMSTGGVYVYNTVTPGWSQINFVTIFPSGTIINNNAITGDVKGNIYIGTNNGLIRFGAVSSSAQLDPLDSTFYKKFTTNDGLPANNVKSIAVDYRASRLVIATDGGIFFKYNLCKDCINTSPVYSAAAGIWDDPLSWANGKIPGENDVIIVKHAVLITQNTNCKSIRVVPPGSITVQAGATFTVQGVVYQTN